MDAVALKGDKFWVEFEGSAIINEPAKKQGGGVTKPGRALQTFFRKKYFGKGWNRLTFPKKAF